MTIEYDFVHLCDDVPTDARYCPFCGCKDPYNELALYLIECAMIQIQAENRTTYLT